MTTADPAVPIHVQGPVSIARQHGEACFHCGAVAKTLYADGTITLPGSDRVWPVVTCGCRRQAPVAARSLPSTAGLSEDQLRGTACVWCKAPLNNATAIDLSPGRRRLLDTITEWFPRACPACAGKQAHDALAAHAPFCELCIENAADCETGRALTRLVQDGRRAEATA